MKTPLRIAAVSIACVALLSACSSGTGASTSAAPSADGGSKTLTAWVLSDNAPYFKSVATDFEAANPGVKVKVVEYANEAYKTAIQVGIASDSPPDIFHNDPGEASFKFVRDNQVLDLTAAAAKDGWDSSLAAGANNSVTLDGKIWGVPWTQQSKFMFYNKDIFAAQGLTPPADLTGLISMCGALSAKGITPISFGNSERWPGIHYMTILNQKVVGEKQIAIDYAGTAAADQLFTDPAYEKALQVLVDMQNAGCFNKGVNSVSPEIARATFYTGKSAMTFCGTWCPGMFDENGLKGKYDAFPFPAIPSGAGDQGLVISGPTVMQISAKTKVPDVATAFAAFLVSSPEQRKLVEMTKRIPTNVKSVDGVSMDAALASVIKQLGAASGTTLWLDSAASAGVSDAYQNAVQSVLGGKATPAQAMETVRAAAKAGKK